jgi:hypothetical protein
MGSFQTDMSDSFGDAAVSLLMRQAEQKKIDLKTPLAISGT